ncbi:MAG TPA: PEP-CTERM sorting domain-containing protein [Burkholderiaceae bacterium]|jgi:hypothetical protein
MQYPIVRSIALAAAVLLPALAHADVYQVRINTSIADVSASSSLAGIMPTGSVAVLVFNVDSGNFSDSTVSPARGYVIDPSSVYMESNGTQVHLTTPDPSYFGMRNNAPKADSFFLGNSTSGSSGFAATVDGSTDAFTLTYGISWSDGLQIGSLDIADAVGVHTSTGLGSYQFDLMSRGSGVTFNPGRVMITDITPVPEPATYGMMALGLVALVGVARRRRAD